MTAGDTPLKLGFFVLCDSLDELYHGLFDAAAISTFRLAVFYGLVTNEFNKTIERIKIENEENVDTIIQRYMDYEKGKNKVTDLQAEI